MKTTIPLAPSSLTKFHNNTIEYCSILYENQTKDEKEDKEEQEEKKVEELDNIEKEIDNSMDNITTTAIESDCYSRYRYTPKQIEEFFTSDNGQTDDHILEDSICRPLIGIQNNTPSFLYL